MMQANFTAARDFMLQYARLIDRQLFAYLFEGGSQQAVLTALLAYRNADGGFGNALEPDKRVPDSQPVDAQVALEILEEIDALHDPKVQAEVLVPLCDFLQSVSTSEGGLPFALPSVLQYPRAPWWQTEAGAPADLNPTAAVVGLLLRSGVAHPWLAQAEAYCWRAIEALDTDQYHVLMPVITFLENAPDRARAGRLLEQVAERIRRPGVVEFDPLAQGYLKMPLDWAPTPQSFCRALFDSATIAEHLEALAARQQPDGGWPISWTPVSPAVEYEWRGHVTVQALRTLRAYA